MPLFGVDLKDVGGAVGSLGTLAKDVRAAITGKAVIDPAAQAALELKASELEAKIVEAQIAVNQAEAANTSLFVSGWRPALGWIGALAIALQYIIRPIFGGFGLSVPSLNMDELWPLIMGILGLGGMRSYEKGKGVARK